MQKLNVGASETAVELSQIEQISSLADQARRIANTLADGLRDMRNAAFGQHPEAVPAPDKVPQPVGAIGNLRAQIQQTCEVLATCEALLREVRRIV